MSIPLREDEIQRFCDELDANQNGEIDVSELERKLQAVHDEIDPEPQEHHLHHPERAHRDLHHFLQSLLPGCAAQTVSRTTFEEHVRSWNIPSQDQSDTDDEAKAADEYDRRLSWIRRGRAWWSVRGPEAVFVLFVAALILAFSLWQGLIYATNPAARAALGWGVIVAKFSAGALYPCFFFLILSMSRWIATWTRQSYLLYRFINWDFSQAFHIRMSCLALFFSCAHAIGHLTGTFVFGSSPGRQAALAAFFGPRYVSRSYADYVSTRPGWSGLTALISFLLIAVTSIPWLRRKNYQIFQFVHLLMYLMFAMLALHGTLKLLQAPMLGYWLVFPVVCVLLERCYRLYLTFFGHHQARAEALDDGTVVITAEKPEGKNWRVRAGQYVLVQVPGISRFQWHPFTVSACVGNRLQVHIKADGDWTQKLHELAIKGRKEGKCDYTSLKVGIDGGFGAPAQRFYTFDKSIVIGAGIGVTPFAACLTDLLENHKSSGDPWKLTRTSSFGPMRKRTIEKEGVAGRDSAETLRNSNNAPSPKAAKPHEPTHSAGSYNVRRCDFHWSVREKNDLLWFSDLLNRATDLAESDAGTSRLTLNVHAHITAKRKNISTHIFRYLLDSYRTEEHPYSALTGLRARAHFGRPDFERILSDYYEDMRSQGWHGRVAVFFCGPPAIGEMLADLCSQMTLRARADGLGMRFFFQNEVFN